jgi:primase-polymerase (primpol)-like protein
MPEKASTPTEVEEDGQQDTVPAEPSERWIAEAIQEGPHTVPDSLRHREIWICYSIEECNGETSKVPKRPYIYQGRVYNTSPTNLEEATDYGSAMKTVHQSKAQHAEERALDGVGLLIHEENDIVGIDCDYALKQTDSGYDVKEWVLDIIQSTSSYTEISPSSSGTHTLCWGELADGFQDKNSEIGLEVYDSDRFFTFTGRCIKNGETELKERTSALRDIQQAWLPEKKSTDSKGDESSDSSLTFDERNVPDDEIDNLTQADKVVIKRGCQSDEEFRRLWNGDISNYGHDHSAADYAFACKLAYRCRSDLEQIVRIFKHSGLMRTKFYADSCPVNYGRYTIKNAIEENGR